jgi:hypothetical protein
MPSHEPDWFLVVGGPPPGEVFLRELILAVLVLLMTVGFAWLLPSPWRLFQVVSAPAIATLTFLFLRQTWRRNQGIRVLGSVLEHRDGQRLVQVALTRAMVSTAAAAPGLLVMVLDDGRSHVTVARRAIDEELIELPPSVGPFLELSPDDFEAVRRAAQRTYAQA